MGAPVHSCVHLTENLNSWKTSKRRESQREEERVGRETGRREGGKPAFSRPSCPCPGPIQASREGAGFGAWGAVSSGVSSPADTPSPCSGLWVLLAPEPALVGRRRHLPAARSSEADAQARGGRGGSAAPRPVTFSRPPRARHLVRAATPESAVSRALLQSSPSHGGAPMAGRRGPILVRPVLG